VSSAALHKAIYDALTSALSCPIYDAVPQGSAYPYVVIDSHLARNQDALNKLRDRETVYLSVWSDYMGQKEVLDLMAAIKTALHNTKPALESGACAILRVIRDTTSRDIGGETYIGNVTLEAVIES
jgi:hypothetical protein